MQIQTTKPLIQRWKDLMDRSRSDKTSQQILMSKVERVREQNRVLKRQLDSSQKLKNKQKKICKIENRADLQKYLINQSSKFIEMEKERQGKCEQNSKQIGTATFSNPSFTYKEHLPINKMQENTVNEKILQTQSKSHSMFENLSELLEQRQRQIINLSQKLALTENQLHKTIQIIKFRDENLKEQDSYMTQSKTILKSQINQLKKAYSQLLIRVQEQMHSNILT